MRTGKMNPRCPTFGWKVSLAVTALLATAACSCGDDTSTGGAGGGTGGTNPGGGGSGAGTTTTGGGGQSAGGSGGVGGTGGVGPSGETCAEAIPVTASAMTVTENGTISASTTGDYLTFCADSEGSGEQYPELVYEVTVGSNCIFHADLNAEFDGAISFRTLGCETDDYCLNNNTGATENFATAVAAGTYHVIVTAVSGTGDYSLDLTCEDPACGDSFQTGTEECDDGNTTSGDGCGATCLLEGTEASLTCAGAEASAGFPINLNQVIHIPSGPPYPSTINAQNNGRGTCMDLPDGVNYFDSPDEVYKIVPSASGTLQITVGRDENEVAFCGMDEVMEPAGPPYPVGCFLRAIFARAGDCDAGTESACADTYSASNGYNGFWWDVETMSFAVTAGTPYFVFVDGGWDDLTGFDRGAYVVRAELTP